MKARRTPCPSCARTRHRRLVAVGGVLQAAAVTAVLALTLGACSDGDSDNQADPGHSTSSPVADPTAEESATDPRLVGAPEIGTCWQGAARPRPRMRTTGSTIAAGALHRTAHDSRRWRSIPLDKPTPKLGMEEGAACGDEASTASSTPSTGCPGGPSSSCRAGTRSRAARPGFAATSPRRPDHRHPADLEDGRRQRRWFCGTLRRCGGAWTSSRSSRAARNRSCPATNHTPTRPRVTPWSSKISTPTPRRGSCGPRQPSAGSIIETLTTRGLP